MLHVNFCCCVHALGGTTFSRDLHSIEIVNNSLILSWIQMLIKITTKIWPLLRAHCTKVIQLWTRVKFDLNLVQPQFVLQQSGSSVFSSEPPSDRWSNFDLGSSDKCQVSVAAKNCPIRILPCPKNYYVSNYKTSIEIMLMTWISQISTIFILCYLCAQ